MHLILICLLNAVFVFNQITAEDMEELRKDSILGVDCLYIPPEKTYNHQTLPKSSKKLYGSHLLQFDRMTFKQGVLHHLYIKGPCKLSSLLSTKSRCFRCSIMAKAIQVWKEPLPYAENTPIGTQCTRT